MSTHGNSVKVTMWGREIESPVFAWIVMIGLTLISIPVLTVGIVVMVAVLALTMPVHWLLRMVGREGFVVRDEDGPMYSPSMAGFRRVQTN